jgi:hypothetical protein
MKFVMSCLIFASAAVFAAQLETPLQLRQAVADDIQGLLDDTVNEGEQTAEVVQAENGPDVQCRISDNRQQPGFKWAFCTVRFEVQWEDDSAFRRCGLLYTFNPGWISKSLDRGDDESFDSCLEDLSESL